MGTGESAFNIFGEKLYQRRGRDALPLLVRQAIAGKPIRYSDLANEMGMPNPRNLNYVLGAIGQTLKDLEASWGTAIPVINCIVVNKATGLPGDGVAPFIDVSGMKFTELPRAVQRRIVDGQLASVFSYQRWPEVLKAVGLEVTPAATKVELEFSSAGFGGGESSEHLALKEYVSKHPTVIGLPAGTREGTTEYALPSGDFVDIVFAVEHELIAVEVKPEFAAEFDIRRGMFQCVKYHAVIEAMQAVQCLAPSSRAILAIGGSLPKELVAVRNTLGIDVFERLAEKASSNQSQ